MWSDWWDWEIEFRVNSMRDRYLEITYRKGKVVAAYLYLPRQPREKNEKRVGRMPFYFLDASLG